MKVLFLLSILGEEMSNILDNRMIYETSGVNIQVREVNFSTCLHVCFPRLNIPFVGKVFTEQS